MSDLVGSEMYVSFQEALGARSDKDRVARWSEVGNIESVFICGDVGGCACVRLSRRGNDGGQPNTWRVTHDAE
jgi:hypothetical protein